jgi:hypothetical protein
MMQEEPCGLIRKAAAYMDSLALLIPKEVIPRRHDRTDVFRAVVSRLSKPAQESQVFMTHKLEYDRAYLNIKSLDASPGEEFQVRSIAQCEESDFVKAYNENKPPLLENTKLDWRNGKFWMTASRLEFELRSATLRAQEGKMVIDAKLDQGDKNWVKIAVGSDGADVRLHRDHSPVTSMMESREGLLLTYRRDQDQPLPHRRMVAMPWQGSGAPEWRHEFRLNPNGVSIARPIELKADRLSVIFSEENRLRAGAYWTSYEGEGEKKWHQGDIGESIVLTALRKSGFEIFSEHTKPKSDRLVRHKSENNGMDGVIECGGTYQAVSAKHWLEPEKALANAREDLERFGRHPDRKEFEDHHQIDIDGGIAVEVYWSYKERVGIIYTDHVKLP